MILFFDIDGTLLGGDGKLSPKSIEALNKAKGKGHELIIASGRSKGSLPKELSKIAWDGFVLGSGIYGEYRNQVILKEEMDRDVVHRLLDFISMNNEIAAVLENNEGSYLTASGHEKVRNKILRDGYFPAEQVDEIMEEFIQVKDLKEIDTINKIMYFSQGDYHKEMIENFQTEFDFLPNSVVQGRDYEDGEIQKKGVTKAKAMERIIKHCRYEKKNVVAFGDGYNDMEMIQSAGIGVAMGNGIDALKKVADYVTDTQEADGVYKAMNLLKLI